MIKIIYEQKENRAAAYDDEKFIGKAHMLSRIKYGS